MYAYDKFGRQNLRGMQEDDAPLGTLDILHEDHTFVAQTPTISPHREETGSAIDWWTNDL